MQSKPIAAIIVLSLVVASLLIAGCTTSTTNQSPTPRTATHDAFLENYLAVANNTTHSDKNQTVKSWEITWINSTSARVELATLNKSENRTWGGETTYIVFPTTQDATNYLNAMNKTSYSLASTEYPSGGNYQKATGHAPQIYKKYDWNEGNLLNISGYKYHQIEQVDNLIAISTTKALS
jgi:hypothetical protein